LTPFEGESKFIIGTSLKAKGEVTESFGG